MNVLVYPNITYARNLEADSYIVLLGAILRRLAVIRPDIRFTLLLPAEVESLRLPNTEQVEWPLPTYPNAMRCHFDVPRFLEIVDWRHRSWDVVWSHLPEHTTQIRNVFYNSTDERPVIVGYCHWFEIPELHNMAADTLDLNLAGIASMDFCGVNSRWLKDLVLGHARKRVSTERADRLASTIHPQVLGADLPTVGDVEPFDPPTFIWNHRATTYTGFPQMLGVLDRLWDRRQDWRLMVTLAGDPPDRPYAVPSTVDHADRGTYYETLARGFVGLPRTNCQWSIAVVDGMAVGLPYVVPRDFCYPEMFPEDYLLFTDGTLEDELEAILNTPASRGRAADQARAGAAALSWDTAVGSWDRMFCWAEARLSRIGPRSAKYTELRDIVAAGTTNKAGLKKAMGWGIGIPWTSYRTRLRDDGFDLP